MSDKGDLTVIYSIGLLDSKKIWSNIHPGKFGYDVAYERTSVHPLHVSRCQESITRKRKAENVSVSVCLA